ncbi:MAG: DUF5667 domain-containing protein [Candidatus Paceibacterota bacterium]
MKRFSEQLKTRAGNIKLREDERKELRARLLSYMEYHPLPQSDGLNSSQNPLTVSGGVFFKYLSKGHIWGKVVGLASVFLLVFIPAMAENALPGETLYPVKVRFNEELRGALASSPYQKIEWETERLERRVSEARLLADSGRLTPTMEAGMAVAIKQHSDAAKESIDSIRVNDKSEAALAEIALVSALEVSAEMLTDRKSSETGTGSTLALSSAVNQAKASMTMGEDIPSYGKLMARLEIETTRAYEYLGSLSSSISKETHSDIESRLGDVKTKINDASKLKDEDEELASKLLVEALSSTRKVISFMTNLNARNNIRIEDLVPAALSSEERKVVLAHRLEELDTEIIKIQEAVATLATSSIDYQNLTEEIENHHSLRVAINSGIESDNLASAEKSLMALVELVARLSHSIKVLGIEI